MDCETSYVNSQRHGPRLSAALGMLSHYNAPMIPLERASISQDDYDTHIEQECAISDLYSGARPGTIPYEGQMAGLFNVLSILDWGQNPQNAPTVQVQDFADNSATSGTRFCKSLDGRVGLPDDIWDNQKASIWRLYIDENKTLTEVMAIMKSKGFNATTKMYKSRFSRWGWIKNNRRRDVEAMIEIKRQRMRMGENTEFTRNEKPVQLDNYLRRARWSKLQSVSPCEAPALPCFVRLQTPPPQPFLAQFQGAVVSIFTDMLSAYLGSCDALLTTTIYGYEPSSTLSAIQDIFNGARLVDGGVGEGHLLLRRGFNNIHQIFDQETLLGITSLYVLSLESENTKIFRILWRYLKSYSIATNRHFQPVYLLVEAQVQLYEQKVSVANEAMEATMALLYEQFLLLGVQRCTALVEAVLGFSSCCMPSQKKLGSAFVDYAVNDKTPIDEYSFLRMSQFCVWHYIHESTFEEMDIVNKIMDEVMRRESSPLVDDLLWFCTFLQASLHIRKWEEFPDRRNPRLGIAIHLMREYIFHYESDARDLMLIHRINVLESYERHAGLIEEADATAARVIAARERFANMFDQGP